MENVLNTQIEHGYRPSQFSETVGHVRPAHNSAFAESAIPFILKAYPSHVNYRINLAQYCQLILQHSICAYTQQCISRY